MLTERTIAILGEDALRAALRRDTTRLAFYERNEEVFVGYVPRQRRGPTPSRAERNRMNRFAYYVYNVRWLPLRIRCVAPVDRCAGRWEVPPGGHGATYLPPRAWMIGGRAGE